jgi:hypothetical protein
MAAHAGQMHTWLRASAGMRASVSRGIVVAVHQQGGWGWPLARSSSMAQRLDSPHSGQRAGSGAGAVVMPAV